MRRSLDTGPRRAVQAIFALVVCAGLVACGGASHATRVVTGVTSRAADGERLAPVAASRRASFAACLRHVGIDVPAAQIEAAALLGGPKGVAGRTARFRSLWEACRHSADVRTVPETRSPKSIFPHRPVPTPDTINRY